MAAIDIRKFFGQKPRVSDRLLPDEYASRIVEADVEDFALRPHQQPANTGVVFATEPKTIVPHYSAPTALLPNTAPGTFDGWFWLEHETNVVANVVPNDIYNRIYFLDDAEAFRITDGDNISLSQTTESPTTDWPLGVPAPTTTPTVTIGGTPGGSPEFRTYVYTFVDRWGAEGPPSPVSDVIEVELNETVTVGNFDSAPAGYNFTGAKIRIYRTVTGSNATDFQFVDEISLGTATYVDSSLYEELGEILPSRQWFPPPEVEGFERLTNGCLAGFQNNTIYFSDPYLPHAWPPEYSITLDHKIIALKQFGGSLVALTNGTPYLIGGNLPQAPVESSYQVNEPCSFAKSALVIDNALYYASPNGLVRIDQNGVRNLSEESITRRQWETLIQGSFNSAPYNNHYVGFFDTGGSSELDDPPVPAAGAFMFRPEEQDFLFYLDTATAVTTRPDTELLYHTVVDGSNWDLYEWNSGASKSFTWESKVFTLPRPLNFSCGHIIADEYPVTLVVEGDEQQIAYIVVATDDPFRLPALNKYMRYRFIITSDYAVNQISIAQSIRELKEL